MQSRGRTTSRLSGFMADHGITRTDLAADLNQSISNVARKVKGDVPWTLDEFRAVSCSLARRVGRPIGWDEIIDPVSADAVVDLSHTEAELA